MKGFQIGQRVRGRTDDDQEFTGAVVEVSDGGRGRWITVERDGGAGQVKVLTPQLAPE